MPAASLPRQRFFAGFGPGGSPASVCSPFPVRRRPRISAQRSVAPPGRIERLSNTIRRGRRDRRPAVRRGPGSPGRRQGIGRRPSGRPADRHRSLWGSPEPPFGVALRRGQAALTFSRSTAHCAVHRCRSRHPGSSRTAWSGKAGLVALGEDGGGHSPPRIVHLVALGLVRGGESRRRRRATVQMMGDKARMRASQIIALPPPFLWQTEKTAASQELPR